MLIQVQPEVRRSESSTLRLQDCSLHQAPLQGQIQGEVSGQTLGALAGGPPQPLSNGQLGVVSREGV